VGQGRRRDAGLIKTTCSTCALDVLAETVRLVQEHEDRADLGAIGLDDPAIYNLMRADTIGLFRWSPAQMQMLPKMKPTSFEA
jgi:DNA polymerase III alpha subunit